MPAIVRDARRPAHVPEVTAPIRDFRHTPAHPLRSYNLGMSGQKWLNVAAIGTWLVCAIYPLTAMSGEPFTVWPAGVWITAFLAYGVALMAFLGLPVMTPGRFGPHFPVALAGLQSVTGLLMNVISSHHWGGTGIGAAMLVIVAAEIPYILPYRIVWLWIVAQTLLMTGLFWPRDAQALMNVVSFGIAMGGFQLFAAASSMLARREQAAREKLAAANTELHATRALLAENSRAAERLRISRDLHDTLGHHLTALSLQLDVASRISDGKATEHVRQAHAITRLLLADVRDVVSTLRDGRRADVVQVIRALAVESAGVTIHLDLPESLAVGDAARADALIRCVQEIITNAARHSQAHNLWIQLAIRADGIALDARDDGRGATSIDCGHGLKGMRERFEEHAGHVEFGWGQGAGFRVHGFLPLPAGA
jgi:signal transduction histidine kinase